jgi:hypothetical protein
MASSDDDIQIAQSPKEVDNAPLFVSVYVVILAFFIVLNSMSKVDQSKLENLVESVNQAFNMPSKVFTTKEKDDGGLNEVVAQFFNEVQNWAQTIFKIDGLEIIKKGNTMLVRIPTNKIFSEGKAEFTESSEPKVKELARLLSGWMQNFRLTAEIVIETSGYELANEKTLEILAIERAGLFAETLTEMGVNGMNIAPGIRKTGEDFIAFRFVLFASHTNAMPGKTPVNSEKAP